MYAQQVLLWLPTHSSAMFLPLLLPLLLLLLLLLLLCSLEGVPPLERCCELLLSLFHIKVPASTAQHST
jgi:hypothetical protein